MFETSQTLTDIRFFRLSAFQEFVKGSKTPARFILFPRTTVDFSDPKRPDRDLALGVPNRRGELPDAPFRWYVSKEWQEPEEPSHFFYIVSDERASPPFASCNHQYSIGFKAPAKLSIRVAARKYCFSIGYTHIVTSVSNQLKFGILNFYT